MRPAPYIIVLFLILVLTILPVWSAEYPSLDKGYSWSYNGELADVGNITMKVSIDYSENYSQWIMIEDLYKENGDMIQEYVWFMYDNWTVDYVIIYDPVSDYEIHGVYEKPEPFYKGFHPSRDGETYTDSYRIQYFDPNTGETLSEYNIDLRITCRSGYNILYRGHVIPVYQVNYTKIRTDGQGETKTIEYIYYINKDFRLPFAITLIVDGNTIGSYQINNYTITPDPINKYPEKTTTIPPRTTTTTTPPSTITTTTQPATTSTGGQATATGSGGQITTQTGGRGTSGQLSNGEYIPPAAPGGGGGASAPDTLPLILGAAVTVAAGAAGYMLYRRRRTGAGTPPALYQQSPPSQPPTGPTAYPGAPRQARAQASTPQHRTPPATGGYAMDRPAQPRSVPQGRKICPYCGAIIPAKAKFCPVCGARQPE